MTKIAACLIVKDAEKTIERCLDSIRPFVDGVFVYDTGSTDGTLELLERLGGYDRQTYAPDGTKAGMPIEREMLGGLTPEGQAEGLVTLPLAPITVERGEWNDDFAWAREQSFAMPDETFDWLLWLDDDDIVEGAANLRTIAAQAHPSCDGFVVVYDYARDENGTCVCVLWRERLIRRAAGYRWQNPIHEVLVPPEGKPPTLAQLQPELLRYVHHRPAERYDADRNLKVLRAEEQRTGGNPPPRTLAYLGTELMTKGAWDEAASYLQRYIEHPESAWSDERMQVHHKLAICLRMLGNPLAAVEVEMQALKERDDWAETYVGLAESFAQLGRWDRVERWSRRALELGAPVSPLILNPLEFTLVPRLRLAEAAAARMAFDEAQGWLTEAAQAAPGQQVVAEKQMLLAKARDEGEALQSLLKLRELLVRFDENEKAWRLLELAVPYVVAEHPMVLRARADQREMVKHLTHADEYRRWYEEEPKESTLTDEHIDHVGDWFGRVAGLMRGLQMQEEELGRKPVVLDLGCNDWWMGEFLARHGYRCDGVELNKRSFEKAIERRDRFGRKAKIVQGDLHDAWHLLGFDEPQVYAGKPPDRRYDAVVMYEVLEHVPDVEATLAVMESLCKPGGRVYISTPNGAFEHGRLPNWAQVERKGHLRAIPIHELADLLLDRGELQDLEETNGDRVTFASYTPKPRKGSITFYAGQQWEPWSADQMRTTGIGGSETALVQIATRLGLEGWKVKVYSGAEPGVIGGALFRPFTAWDPTEPVDLLVVSRLPHVFDNPIGAEQTALWCHDHSYPGQLTEERADKIDHVVVLSDWQRERFERLYPYTADKLTVIRNGVTLRELADGSDRFPDHDAPFFKRKPRVLYSSSADRGLNVLLELWPRIRHQVADAELHVFYGFETLDRVATVNPELAAFKQALVAKVAELGGEAGGVFLRGRVGQDLLGQEMQEARVLAYPTAFLETSCITAMEARAAGLPIVTSRLGALAETVGAHGRLIRWSDDEDEQHNRSEEYQDAFVASVAAHLSRRLVWEKAHAAALDDREELDWSLRIPEWETLARPMSGLGEEIALASASFRGGLGITAAG